MDRMLVVVFDSESKASKGREALLLLDREGSITVYASAVVAKHADGTVTVKQRDDTGPRGILAGTSVGALIGLLGGPAGLAIGAGVGLVAGVIANLHRVSVGEDFIDDVDKVLLPNRVAVVAEIEEEWTTPVDDRMETIGGTIFRRTISVVKESIHEEHIAAMKADIAQMKAELAKAHTDRKTTLQEKFNQLDTKLQAQIQKAKDRRQAAEHQAQAKVEILQAKAKGLKAKAAEPRI